MTINYIVNNKNNIYIHIDTDKNLMILKKPHSILRKQISSFKKANRGQLSPHQTPIKY